MGSHHIALDSNAIIVDGRRIWLTSGAMHYFRMPREMWKPCLELCRDAGLNCVETYVAWNVHEPQEGKIDFSGDHDLIHFLELAHELGLWVILRVGPYICAEQTLGGYPTWLLAKPGIRLRESEPTHDRYVRQWFKNLLPRIAPLQATRGGPILLVQVENEYAFPGKPGGKAYLEMLQQLTREHCSEVPMISCNALEICVADTTDCYNGRDDFTLWLNQFYLAQPDRPRIVSEYYPGWFDTWFGPTPRVRTPRQVYRDAIDITANGGMINYYMFAGGTNFGLTAGRSGLGQDMFMTTTYDYDAPIGEGLCTGEKYDMTRLANRVINLFSDALTHTKTLPAWAPREGWCFFDRLTDHGSLLFGVRRADQGESLLTLQSPDGIALPIDARDIDAFILPYAYQLREELRIDHTAFQPFAWADGELLLFATPDAEGPLMINGDRAWLRAPGNDQYEPTRAYVGGINIKLINTGAAAKWQSLTKTSTALNNRVDHSLAPPRLTQIQPLGIDPALSNIKNQQNLVAPIAFEELNCFDGYGWYSCKFNTDHDNQINVFFPGAADRVNIFIDSKHRGTFGTGPDAGRSPIKIPIHRGINRWNLLVEALGYRNSTLPLTDRKGIWLPPQIVSDITPIQRHSPQLTRHPGIDYEPEWSSHRRTVSGKQHPHTVYSSVRFDFPFSSQTARNVWLSLGRMPNFSWVFLNRNLIATHDRGIHANFIERYFRADELETENQLTVISEAPCDIINLIECEVYALSSLPTSQIDWKFNTWQKRKYSAGVNLIDNGTANLPSWYSACFDAHQSTTMPLFLSCEGLSKGMLFLNGHQIGRYWNGSRQYQYFLPWPWLKPKNTLVFYDEYGKSPRKARLQYRHRFRDEAFEAATCDTEMIWENNV